MYGRSSEVQRLPIVLPSMGVKADVFLQCLATNGWERRPGGNLGFGVGV